MAIVAMTACTQPLTEDQASRLTNTSQQIGASLSLSATLQQQAHDNAYTTQNLCRYLAGQSDYGLGQLAPELDIGQTAKDRLALARKLTAYLEALIEASRGESLNDLETARDDFVAAASRLTPTTAPIEPVLGGSLRLFGRIAEAQRQREIRSIMDGVADAISTLPVILRGDQAAVLADVEAQIARYEHAARCVLRVQRTDDAAAEAFAQYDTSIRSLRAQTALIAAAPALVARLRTAHIEIADETVSFATGLGQLADVLDDINTITSEAN
ncbi:hypothetical protein [Pseudooctadecabacter jejudonensis]|uniref:hypothetical protein n=1 Tax=Pseudooctadecabacter jejudonensis TaxID=1391910 RepID=UPI00117A50B6|nr:hypothetical protein [Pseudooctadecabacter jejudonensis]